MNNLGCKIKIKFTKESPFFKAGCEIDTLRNVTEIHYKYPSIVKNQIAFESDIHRTGMTYRTKWIKEFETKLENKKAKNF